MLRGVEGKMVVDKEVATTAKRRLPNAHRKMAMDGEVASAATLFLTEVEVAMDG